MQFTRRTMLGALTGLAALPLASCQMLPAAFQPPPTVFPTRPVRLAGIMSQNLSVAEQANYRRQYQQVVDIVAGNGVNIDKAMTWIQGTSPGQTGYAAGMETFHNIETAYMGSAADYARASQVGPALTVAFYNNLLTPLQQGTQKPADICKAATDAINAILHGKAATPGPT
jgi:hypothetical protein